MSPKLQYNHHGNEVSKTEILNKIVNAFYQLFVLPKTLGKCNIYD